MVLHRLLFVIWSATCLSACTTHVYTGRINAPDTTGNEREVVLYWTDTRFIGTRKAGPAVLMTECGDRLTFQERPDGIIFRGQPEQDRLIGQDIDPGSDFECGRFIRYHRFIDISDGLVSLSIKCEPVSGEFSAFPRNYIAASLVPYEFGVASKKYWNFFGSHKGVPLPPDCQTP